MRISNVNSIKPIVRNQHFPKWEPLFRRGKWGNLENDGEDEKTGIQFIVDFRIN